VEYYAEHWMGAWNHGLKQDIQLLGIACQYPKHAFGGLPLRWRTLARKQMIAAFAPNRLGPAIDAQGATNEQSTGYASFTYRLWTTALYQQLWHLDPGLKVTVVRRTYAVATAPGTQLQIRQVPLPGQRIPQGSTRVIRGQRDPYQGWGPAGCSREPAHP
jgi:hypothetical protein